VLKWVRRMLLASIKELGKHSIIYGSGRMLSRLLGVFLLPIYTRYLTPADYGILSLLLVTGSIAGIITKLGLGSALFREVIYQESDESTVESTALYFLIVEAAVLFGVLIALSTQVSRLIFGTPEHARLLSLVFLTGLLDVFGIVVMARLRIRKQSVGYSALSLARFVIAAFLNIYFIVVLERGVEGLILAALILEVIFAVIYMIILFKDLRLTVSLPILQRMLSYGVPLVPFGLAKVVMVSSDRYFLQYFCSTSEVGLYSLGYSIGMLINLMVQSVQLAWPAHMFSVAKKQDAERQLSKMLTYYLFILGFVGLGLSVLAREVLVIMTTPKFYGAHVVVPLVAVSYILYGVMYMTNSALETQSKTRYMVPIIFICAAINLALNYLMIPRYGMMGAAWATVISYIVLVVITVIVNLRFWYIPYEYSRIAKLVFAWIVIYGSSLLVQSSNIWLSVCLKLILLAAYPLLLYVLSFYEKRELATVKLILQTGIGRVL